MKPRKHNFLSVLLAEPEPKASRDLLFLNSYLSTALLTANSSYYRLLDKRTIVLYL
jgi:hypothetical protein